MFTGIVEETGAIAEVTTKDGGIRVRIETALTPHLAPGASLAVNGVCLTVVLKDEGHVLADIGPETARITTLGGLQQGQTVNLERPMRMDGRLDGHFVLGHVDGVGTVTELRPEADSHWLAVEFPAALASILHPQGVGGRGRHQPDGRGSRRTALRRAGDSLHLVAHRASAPAVGRQSEPRVRRNGKHVARALWAMGVHGKIDPQR